MHYLSIIAIYVVVILGLIYCFGDMNKHQDSFTNRLDVKQYNGTPVLLYNQDPYLGAKFNPLGQKPIMGIQTSAMYQNSNAILPIKSFTGKEYYPVENADVGSHPDSEVIQYRV